MKVRQAEHPGLSAVCQCLTGSGLERIKGVGLGGGRVPEKEEV